MRARERERKKGEGKARRSEKRTESAAGIAFHCADTRPQTRQQRGLRAFYTFIMFYGRVRQLCAIERASSLDTAFSVKLLYQLTSASVRCCASSLVCRTVDFPSISRLALFASGDALETWSEDTLNFMPIIVVFEGFERAFSSTDRGPARA